MLAWRAGLCLLFDGCYSGGTGVGKASLFTVPRVGWQTAGLSLRAATHPRTVASVVQRRGQLARTHSTADKQRRNDEVIFQATHTHSHTQKHTRWSMLLLGTGAGEVGAVLELQFSLQLYRISNHKPITQLMN